MSPLSRFPALATVGLAIIAAGLGLLLWGIAPGGLPHTLWSATAFAGGAALLFLACGRLAGLGNAWLVLGTVATPMLVLLPLLRLPGWAFLIPAALLGGFYVNGVTEKVPLFLTNPRTKRAIADLVPLGEGRKVIDLGCGLGGVVAAIARARPDAEVLGVETAPLSYVLAAVRVALFGPRNARIEFRSIWNTDVSEADMVYAFLSPAPMTRLNDKLRAEMKQGALFVSNSFAVPGREPDEVVAVDDTRQTRLLLWRM